LAPGGEDGAAKRSLQVSGSLGAWRQRYAFTARRPGSLLHLGPCDLCQAVLLQQKCVVLLWCAWSTRIIGYIKGQLTNVPWVVA